MANVKRMVSTKFWIDEKVIDNYSVEDKYFLLYLMTNPRTSQLGIYKLPKKIASFETGYTREVIEVLIQRFRDDYKNILYNHETQEVSIVNSLKYSIVKGGAPVTTLLKKELGQVESDDLILKTYDHMKSWWEKSSREVDGTIKQIFEEELEKRNVSKEFNDNVNENDNEESYPESYPESQKPSKSTKVKKTYGEMGNVKLTDEELDKLKDKFSDDYEDKIDNLSFYLAQGKGKSYKSHYAVICKWAKKDTKNKQQAETSRTEVLFGEMEG